MTSTHHHPRNYLSLRLRLRQGIQFNHKSGAIIASMPDVLVPTQLQPWEYRLMLSLNGSVTFVDVVRDVKDKFPNTFEARDVWTLLYWLIEHKLIEEEKSESNQPLSQPLSEPVPAEPERGKGHWIKLPVQVLSILIIGVGAMFATYVATPRLLSFFNDPAGTDVTVVSQAAPVSVTGYREPGIAESEEIEVAANVPVAAPTEPPSPVERLIAMRQELAASQIRRDECYLLDDEKGYRAEVANITRLAEEIGRIRADLFPDSEPSEPELETIDIQGLPVEEGEIRPPTFEARPALDFF